ATPATGRRATPSRAPRRGAVPPPAPAPPRSGQPAAMARAAARSAPSPETRRAPAPPPRGSTQPMKRPRWPAPRPAARSGARARPERVARRPRIRDNRREGGRSAAPVAVRIVAIAVVQQDDRPGPQLAAHAGSDLLGRNAGVRVPHAERPSEHRIAEAAGGDTYERVAVTVRRPKYAWCASGCLDDDLVRALQLF